MEIYNYLTFLDVSCFAGKRKTIEFSKPVFVVKRDDSNLLRKKMGFSKGTTLHEAECQV